jgi:hypothetical protein
VTWQEQSADGSSKCAEIQSSVTRPPAAGAAATGLRDPARCHRRIEKRFESACTYAHFPVCLRLKGLLCSRRPVTQDLPRFLPRRSDPMSTARFQTVTMAEMQISIGQHVLVKAPERQEPYLGRVIAFLMGGPAAGASSSSSAASSVALQLQWLFPVSAPPEAHLPSVLKRYRGLVSTKLTAPVFFVILLHRYLYRFPSSSLA